MYRARLRIARQGDIAMIEDRKDGKDEVSLIEFNDLKDTVKSILSRIEAVEEHVRARNPSEQITTIKDLLRRVEAIEQHIRQHHPNDMK
jgi:hypothetical protein